MKVIDLLNKIANGEEVPKEIFYKKQWWEYNPNNDYEGTDWGGCFLNNVLICDLNDEVEIIEEEKEIKKINLRYVTCNSDFAHEENGKLHIVELLNNFFRENDEIINKLIDEVKKLKEE